MFELFYTSVPRGLVPGTSGYTTVGCTSDMGRTLIEQAERLSSYSSLSGDPTAYAREPINWAHLQSGSGSKFVHIVSRIAACAPDHTGRSNYLAHHAFLSPHEAAATKAGPAALVADPGFLSTQWQGEARYLPARGVPAVIDRGPTTAAIEAAGLDPGWGASLADRLVNQGIKQTFLIYSPGTDIIGIVRDVLSELSPEERWQATFATHATKMFPGLGVSCKLQCVVAGTPYAAEVLARSRSDAFDLTTRPLPPPRLQRPKAITPAAPRPIAAKPTRALPTAPVQTSRTDPFVTMAEPEYENFSPSPTPTPRVTISQPPVMAGDSNVFNSPVTLLLAGLSALMTIGCLLLGSLYFSSNSKLNDLEQRNTKLTGELDKLEKEAGQLRNKLKDLKVTPVQPKKPATETQQTATADASQQQRENRPATPTSSPTEMQADVKPAAGAVITGAEEGAAQPPEKKRPEQADAADVASTSASPAPEESPGAKGDATSGPRRSATVPQDLQAAIAKAEGAGSESDNKESDKGTKPGNTKDRNKSRIVLIDNLIDDKSLKLQVTGTSKLLNAVIKQAGAGKWELLTGQLKKSAARITYDKSDKELVMEVVHQGGPLHYLRFLKLLVNKDKNNTLSIPLGSPIKTTFAIKGETQKDHYTFFDDDTNVLISTLLKDVNDADMSISLTFASDTGIRAFTKESDDLPEYMKGMPSLANGQIALVKKNADQPPTGVVLKRDTSQRAAYIWEDHKYVIDPSMAKEIGKDLDHPPWNWCLTPENPTGVGLIESIRSALARKITAEGIEPTKDIQGDLGPSTRRTFLNDQVTALTSYINSGVQDANKFVSDELAKPHNVRFEIKVSGSDSGLVVVDSLSP